MNKFYCLITLLTLLVNFSCKDDEIPSRAVFGEPDGPIVFNLKVLNPEITSKNIELANYQFGTARLIENTFIIYQPDQSFETDIIDIKQDGSVIANVVFISTKNDPNCNIHAKPITIEVKKNSNVSYYTLDREYCNYKKSGNAIISASEAIPIPGTVIAASGNGVEFIFKPAPDFTGYGEIIYEIGYAPSNFKGQIYETEAFVSGLVQITVTE